MARGDARHSADPAAPGSRRRRRLTVLPLVLVVLVYAAALASYRFDLGERWLGWDYPSPITEPAEVAPPPGLTLPEVEAAPAVAEPLEAQPADPDAVQQALADLVGDKALGPHLAVAVAQLSDGETVFDAGAPRVTPASTLKLLTTTAALSALGPDHHFTTSTVTTGTAKTVTLVGGGDPFLSRAPVEADVYPERADLETLADATAKALHDRGRDRVRLRYDDSLFTGPAVSPDWPASYLPDDVVSPITALWVDEGRKTPGLRERTDDPSLFAARVFARALEDAGVTVRGTPKRQLAAPDADELASVQSAPLARIVQRTLEVSDNEAAEVLFRQVALAEGLPGSFAGGQQAVPAVLDRLGVDTTGLRMLDGSGLSRDNLVAPETELGVLEVASAEDHPELRAVLTGLPVAGWTGSLLYEFEVGDPAGLGRVRAKTGTLTGVHGLTGVTTDLDGTELAFVAVADRVKDRNEGKAIALLQQIAAALAGCHCGAAAADSGDSASPQPSS
ncbi:MAG TPA: D-alanyl-D-alanine carboxypeptidase/D-alanyl-D-alanine-endopeptidase [Nocardioidaceae bacterium]|nr:D-alanyl-D-alanine carboxypeptidase/D-alanyl-D-alanine-endopeptidase [Nocardioidaceae bacterium]